MATITSNIGEVTAAIRAKLAKLRDKDYVPRQLSFDTIDLMTKRIHIDGNDATDGQIGTYSKGYLKLRQRSYSRSADPKIIVSLTRQLENDWSVIATDKGYGVGFLNPFNLQKARWVEEIKEKKIFSLSPSELKVISEVVQTMTRNALE